MDERRALTEKEVAPISNDIIPKELEVNTKGLMGKLKLAFKFVDKKINNTVSNMDSIVIKYHDSTKRKFVWVI
jgi:hypothetical protein